MAFEDIKDQFKEKLTESWSKIQESPIYNNVREKYDTLSPNAQLGLILGISFFAVLMLASIPYSYYSTSQEFEMSYDDNRSLLRGLLRASRLANEVTALPRTPSSNELRPQIATLLQDKQIQPEQIGQMTAIAASELDFEKIMPAKQIPYEGLGISLKKLNLNQLVDLGYELQKMSPSAKLAGMDVKASSPDPHYFDVLYKLVVYNMPTVSEEPPSDQGTNQRFRNPRGAGASDPVKNEETDEESEL